MKVNRSRSTNSPVTMPVRSSSDSKANIHETLPQVGPPPQRRESCFSSLGPKVISMRPSTAKGLDLRTGGCGPPTLRQTWPAAVRAPKFFRTSKPIALIVSTRPPEQNFLFWAKDVHISLLTTRSLGSKKLSSKQRQSRAGRLSRQGPTKGRDFSPRPRSERTPQLPKNLCTECSLYAQQVDPPEVVALVLSHPCKHRPAEPSASAGIHPSHLTLNLGHQWSCSRCNAHHSVRTRVKGPLSKECKGDGKKGGQRPSPVPRVSSAQGFAALFAGRVVPSSDSLVAEFQRPPNPEVPRPKTSVPHVFMARLSQPRHGPEVLTVGPQCPEVPRPNLIR